ncbi:MAG: AlpA family transcriptional regulator [Alcanivorax sp.]
MAHLMSRRSHLMRIMRLTEVIQTTGLARSSIYSRMTEGSFPRPVPLGARSVGWVSEEIQDWVESRIQERDADSSLQMAGGGA